MTILTKQARDAFFPKQLPFERIEVDLRANGSVAISFHTMRDGEWLKVGEFVKPAQQKYGDSVLISGISGTIPIDMCWS